MSTEVTGVRIGMGNRDSRGRESGNIAARSNNIFNVLCSIFVAKATDFFFKFTKFWYLVLISE